MVRLTRVDWRLRERKEAESGLPDWLLRRTSCTATDTRWLSNSEWLLLQRVRERGVRERGVRERGGREGGREGGGGGGGREEYSFEEQPPQ